MTNCFIWWLSLETGGKFQAHYHGSQKDHSKNWELLRISDTLVSITIVSHGENKIYRKIKGSPVFY